VLEKQGSGSRCQFRFCLSLIAIIKWVWTPVVGEELLVDIDNVRPKGWWQFAGAIVNRRKRVYW